MKLNLTEVEKKVKLNPEDNYSILENFGFTENEGRYVAELNEYKISVFLPEENSAIGNYNINHPIINGVLSGVFLSDTTVEELYNAILGKSKGFNFK